MNDAHFLDWSRMYIIMYPIAGSLFNFVGIIIAGPAIRGHFFICEFRNCTKSFCCTLRSYPQKDTL
jgi:hypothetical protein